MSPVTSVDRNAPSPDLTSGDLLSGCQTASGLLGQLLSNAPEHPKVLVIGFERPLLSGTGFEIKEHLLSAAEPSTTLPWDDDEFAAVCATDVIQRFPPQSRGRFLAECLRVARSGIVVSHPGADPCILEAEQFVQLLYRERFHTSHPAFSADEFDRLTPEEMRSLMRMQEIAFEEVQNAPLHQWLAARLRADHGLQHPTHSNEPDVSSIAYRRFYIAAKFPAGSRTKLFEEDPTRTGEPPALQLPGIARILGKIMSAADAEQGAASHSSESL